MSKKVSELDEITNVDGADFLHIVDASDDTDGPDGTSVFATIANILKGKVFGKNTNVPNTAAKAIIFNMSNTSNPSGTQALAGDFVLFMDTGVDRLIIGVALATCAAFPADLDDVAKFAIFHEGSQLIS